MNPDHLFTRPPSVYEQCLVPVADIVPGRWQPRRRFDEQKLNELADSIREFGVLTRPKVFYNENSEYELIAGERRWRASKLAGLAVVPCEVVQWTARQIQEVSIIDNLQRDNLSPEDEGAAFEMAIQQLGVSEAELAKRMSKGRTYVQQRRKLAAAAPELREALARGEITFSIVRGILVGAGSSHDFQKWGLELALKKRKEGHHINEVRTKILTSNKILSDCKEALEKLGWTLRQVWIPELGHIWQIYSGNDKPARWNGQKVYDTLVNEREPNNKLLDSELKGFTKTAEESQTIRLKHVRFNDVSCPPYVRVKFKEDKMEWMSREEFRMFLVKHRSEINQRILSYQKYGIELRLGNADFSLYIDGVPTKHTAIDWTETESLLTQLDSEKIEIKPRYSKELKEVGASTPQEYFDTCVLCNDKGKDYEFYYLDKDWRKLCPTCKKDKVNEKKEETEKIRTAIIKEVTPLLADATDKQLMLIRNLVWAAARVEPQDELAERWASCLWSGDNVEMKRTKTLKRGLRL